MKRESSAKRDEPIEIPFVGDSSGSTEPCTRRRRTLLPPGEYD